MYVAITEDICYIIIVNQSERSKMVAYFKEKVNQSNRIQMKKNGDSIQ